MHSYSFLSLIQEYALVPHFSTASGPISSTPVRAALMGGTGDSRRSTLDHIRIPSLSNTPYRKPTTFHVSREIALEMLRSVDDFRTLGALLRVNRTFYRAYQDDSDALLRATARTAYGDLLEPMLAVAASISQENPRVPPSSSSQLRPTPALFDSSLLNTLRHIHAVLDTWLRIYEYRGPLGLLNYREMFHICASSEAESHRFKTVLLAYWSYSAFHRSVAQYWCICCGAQLPSNMRAFDHLPDVALFQLQSMYDFMYAVVSSLFADFRLDIQLDAIGRIRHILSLGPAYLLNLLTSPTEASSQLLIEPQRTEEHFLSESLHAEIVIKRSLNSKHWQKLAGITDCLTDAGNSLAEDTLNSGSTKYQVLDWLPI